MTNWFSVNFEILLSRVTEIAIAIISGLFSYFVAHLKYKNNLNKLKQENKELNDKLASSKKVVEKQAEMIRQYRTREKAEWQAQQYNVDRQNEECVNFWSEE